MSWDAAVDAGVAVLVSVVDTGIAAGSLATHAAAQPPSAGPGWVQIIVGAGAGSGAVIAGLVAIFGWRVNRKLEAFKHELAEALTKRKLRADYVRDQIEKLYGPLAFLMESSAQLIETAKSMLEWQAKQRNEAETAENPRIVQYGTVRRYFADIAQNNKEGTDILRKEWGWLDEDDIATAGQHLADVARFTVEFEERNGMPKGFYAEAKGTRPLSLYNVTFIDRVRGKLKEKQRELAGLTGAESAEAGPPTPHAPPR